MRSDLTVLFYWLVYQEVATNTWRRKGKVVTAPGHQIPGIEPWPCVNKGFPGWGEFKHLQVLQSGGDKEILIPCPKLKFIVFDRIDHI